MKTWKLKRTVQCAKCPWRIDVDPHDIPNGYDVEKHKKLKSTIADPEDISCLFDNKPRTAMACHELHEAHCIGWLMNQVGPGNNLALRLSLMSCSNAKDLKLIGEQHRTFEDTLP